MQAVLERSIPEKRKTFCPLLSTHEIRIPCREDCAWYVEYKDRYIDESGCAIQLLGKTYYLGSISVQVPAGLDVYVKKEDRY